MNTIFIYGTLLNEGVMMMVLGRNNSLPEYRKAILKDYYKEGLNILEREGSEVEGALIEVNDSDLIHLDRYESLESGLYKKINVKPQVEYLTETEVEEKTIDAIAYQLT